MGTGAVGRMENRYTIIFFIFWAPLVVAIFCYQILRRNYKKD
jgi:hypothetical protein